MVVCPVIRQHLLPSDVCADTLCSPSRLTFSLDSHSARPTLVCAHRLRSACLVVSSVRSPPWPGACQLRGAIFRAAPFPAWRKLGPAATDRYWLSPFRTRADFLSDEDDFASSDYGPRAGGPSSCLHWNRAARPRATRSCAGGLHGGLLRFRVINDK